LDFDIGFYPAGCEIFNNQEEVKCSIPGMESNMGSDCKFSLPSFEPAMEVKQA
jgi:hypothetical protein